MVDVAESFDRTVWFTLMPFLLRQRASDLLDAGSSCSDDKSANGICHYRESPCAAIAQQPNLKVIVSADWLLVPLDQSASLLIGCRVRDALR